MQRTLNEIQRHPYAEQIRQKIVNERGFHIAFHRASSLPYSIAAAVHTSCRFLSRSSFHCIVCLRSVFYAQHRLHPRPDAPAAQHLRDVCGQGIGAADPLLIPRGHPIAPASAIIEPDPSLDQLDTVFHPITSSCSITHIVTASMSQQKKAPP